MKGIRIDFQGNKARLDYKHPLEQTIDCLAQNAVVNTVTSLGSDKVAPKKGTNLKSDFYNGSAYDRARASHTANFAAIESRKFVNRQLPSQQEEKLASFSLVIQGLSEDKRGWEFDAVVQSSLGTESTVTWTLS